MRSHRAIIMTAVTIVALLAMTGVRASFIATGGEGWRTRPGNPYAGAAWGIGYRPIADRYGRVFITTRGAGDAATRRSAVESSDMLARILDLNYFNEVALSERRGILGSRSLQPFRTTIDLTLQKRASELLAGRAGVVVALRPTTGEVLALAANGIDPRAGIPAVPPGSAFKVIVWSGAIEKGAVRRDETFPIERSYGKINNSGKSLCGGSVAQSIAHSCNAAAVRAAEALGRAPLAQTASLFGLTGRAVLVGVEPSTFPPMGNLGSPLAWQSTAIGQFDTRLDPVTAATISAAVATGGVRPSPTFIEHRDGASAAVMSASTAAVLRAGMTMAVDIGTASDAGVSTDEQLAAKTGTAESGLGYDHAWTLAFGPVDQPRLAVAVVLYGSPATALVGGHDATPIALEMIKETR
jgi:peptidoglycan glycosyltransferase